MTPDELIGVPWRSGGRDPATGLDCWGVVRACVPVVPDYATSPDDTLAVARAWIEGRRDTRWRELLEPRDGCIVSMGPRGRATHAGVWWKGRIVHATREQGVRADPAGEMAMLGYPELQFAEWVG